MSGDETATIAGDGSGAQEALGQGSTDDADRDNSLGVHIRNRRQWWHRHLDSEERQRVMTELAIRKQEHWGFRFAIMLTLSVIVAVMGLSADSAAVVIGAMLLAPLMTPVLATAACIAMALFRKSLRSFGVVVLATVGSIALSYVLAALFVNGELPNEVTSRTAPDIRDLVVALGAGTAGAYATVRKDASASLPGVAVAVALVPPLGAVGISLEEGNATFAWGAMLLYTTNLVAIVFAGAVVFIVTGFVPPRRLASTISRTVWVWGVVAAVVVAIAVPLYSASTSAVENSERELEARDIVSAWLGPVAAEGGADISFDGNRILIRIRSFENPPDQTALNDAIEAEFGAEKVVSVEWEKLTQATTTTTAVPSTTIVTDEERRYAQVEAIVDDWLAGLGEDARARRDALTIAGDVVFLDASGTIDSPPLGTLTELLDAAVDQTFEVRLSWVRRENVSDEVPQPTPDEVLAQRINLFARAWADVEGVTITSTSFDGVEAIVEVAGAEPPDASDLVAQLEGLLDPDDAVTVLFVERLDITTTTTTTAVPTATTES